MLLAHKIEIRPTKEQEQFFEQACGSSRHLWNTLLGHFSNKENKWSKKDARQFYYKSREDFEWYNELSANIFQSTIDNIECGFKNFFKHKKGFPKFKKKGQKDSFKISQSPKFSVIGRDLRVEKFNKLKKFPAIKLREKLRFDGKPKQLTISKHGGKWWASILVEVESGYRTYQDQEGSVGADLGIKELATLSNGMVFKKNSPLELNLKRLKRKQRNLSKKKKGSNRYAKAKQELQRLHKKISDLRKSTLHNLSDELTKSYKVICLEDLSVSSMKKNKGFNRAVNDVGMFELRRQLEYKALLRGVEISFVDRYFPSSKMCNECGCIKEDLKLSDRVYKCECGYEADRDLNAAKNILKEGLTRAAS